MSGPRFIAIIVALGVSFAALVAHTGTPTNNSSGAPGASTCRSCHSSFALNSGTASLHVTAPGTVRPGQTVPVTVRFVGATGTRYGFAMIAKDATNATLGTWTVTDTVGTQTINSGSEIGHKNATSQNTWSMNWTAPTSLTTPTVTFYACGVDGNGSGSSGDYVFTTSTTMAAQRLTLGVTSTNQSYSMTLAGGSALAGQEYQVLASAVPAGGPVLGLVPDSLFWALFALPNGLPGVHFNLDATGAASASYPAGTLAALAGIPIQFVAFSRDGTQTLSAVSNIVRVTP